MNEKRIQTDVLCMGTGIAGLMAAIRAAEKGARVVLAEKGHALYSGRGRGGNAPHAVPVQSIVPKTYSLDPGSIPQVTYPEFCAHCSCCVYTCPESAIWLRIPFPCNCSTRTLRAWFSRRLVLGRLAVRYLRNNLNLSLSRRLPGVLEFSLEYRRRHSRISFVTGTDAKV